MRIEGKLTKWNDDRGFGFITPTQGGADIFVHISAFPNDSRRPTIGERLSFEIETDGTGKKRAKSVLCPTRATTARTPRRSSPPANRRSRASFLKRIAPVALIVLGVYGYTKYSEHTAQQPSVVSESVNVSQPLHSSQPVERSASPAFHCDGRIHCSQMTSCGEAEFFLRNCPGVKMDGDRDGIPCEEQWCTSPLAK